MNLDNRVCLVTGAAGGIGRASVLRLADRGARIIAVDRNDEDSAELIAGSGGESRVAFFKADLTEPSATDALVTRALSQTGQIDVLVNCIGVSSLTSFADVTVQEWDTVFNVNLRSVFFLTQKVVSHMVARGSGTVIFVASAAAKLGGVAVGPHYAASKAGVICLTKSLARYGAGYGVTANCVCPGPTRTAMTDSWDRALTQEFAASIPLKRYAEPGEIAEAVCFLASPEAGYITGETIDVNGGLVMD